MSFAQSEQRPEEKPAVKATENTTVAPLPYPDDEKLLLQIHTYKRPHGSPTITDFVEEFIVPLKDHPNVTDYTVFSDGKQPLAIAVVTNPNSETMFSCHVDTVHSTHGKQAIAYDPYLKLLYKSTDIKNLEKGEEIETAKGKVYTGWAECLGADDGAGIWLMLQMIDAGVGGHFLFHFGEERGGIGSSGMAQHHPEYLKMFQRAIAFDRKGTTDIITHQGMGQCCSITFAQALATALNEANSNLKMAPDDGGIFTDTANYTHLIPECSNVSIGYENAHTSDEYLDGEYLFQLRDACIAIDWEALPTEREAKDEWKYEPVSFKSAWGSDMEKLRLMPYTKLKEWVKNATVEEITNVMSDLYDRVDELEDHVYYGGGSGGAYELPDEEDDWRK